VTKPSRVKQEGHGYIWREEKCIQCLCGETERKRLLGNLNGRIISKFIFKKMGWEDMDWICLTENWDK
jgi:hypothetical protein